MLVLTSHLLYLAFWNNRCCSDRICVSASTHPLHLYFPVWTSDSWRVCSTYGVIMLLSFTGKVYSKILKRRLSSLLISHYTMWCWPWSWNFELALVSGCMRVCPTSPPLVCGFCGNSVELCGSMRYPACCYTPYTCSDFLLCWQVGRLVCNGSWTFPGLPFVTNSSQNFNAKPRGGRLPP